jgi:two-component system OmpR family sensor kinase
MKSIGRRLFTLLLGGLMIVGIAAGVIMYLKAREELDELFDYQLTQMAHAFSYQESIVPVPPSSSVYEEEDECAVQVWKDRFLIYATPPGRILPLQKSGFSTVYSNDRYWRVFVIHTGNRFIQVSQPIDARQEISLDFTMRTIAPLLLTIPLFALFIWLAVRAGLRPLARIADDISRRPPSTLDAVPRNGLPDEIIPLADHLNLLLEKLAHAIEVQKRFVADAAHELRTPLAALRLQARVLEKSSSEAERTESLARLNEGIDRAARMVGQLLALARLEPEAPPVFSHVTLTDLAREIVSDQARVALEKGVDLGMTQSNAVIINGEEEALRAMLSNLIDNAVRHTPPGGTVDVSVRCGDREVFVEVIDTGPGIPTAERARVFDRFFRRGDSSGSGVGLAIVKSAVERHGGTITLDDGDKGKGLRATVSLPLVPPRQTH